MGGGGGEGGERFLYLPILKLASKVDKNGIIGGTHKKCYLSRYFKYRK